jgi:hypothetical protein
MFDFPSVEAFYDGLLTFVVVNKLTLCLLAAESAQYLPLLRRPVLFLNALNDPFSEPDRVLPYELFVNLNTGLSLSH